MGITDLITGLSENPYFGAGFGLFSLGAGAALLRRAAQGATILFRRHYMITLEVEMHFSVEVLNPYMPFNLLSRFPAETKATSGCCSGSP
jgi:hypothetical protein